MVHAIEAHDVEVDVELQVAGGPGSAAERGAGLASAPLPAGRGPDTAWCVRKLMNSDTKPPSTMSDST